MFSIEELTQVIQSRDFRLDFDWVRQSMALGRLRQPFLMNSGARQRLNYFVESVLCSAPEWDLERASRICRFAGEITELLSTTEEDQKEMNRTLRFRSALLYELADLPARSSTMLQKGDLYPVLMSLICRTGAFKFLQSNGALKAISETAVGQTESSLEEALSQDALSLINYEQGAAPRPQHFVAPALVELAKHLALGLKSSDILSFNRVIANRLSLSTRSNIEPALFIQAQQIGFPAELWSNQAEAIKAGLLDEKYDSWGFAAPTGTGKTFLARLLILSTLSATPKGKILYLVPTRALVYEVSTSLSAALQHCHVNVQAISAQLIDLDVNERSTLDECTVAVLTPEKADMLLRLGDEFIKEASLVIVDEAHHIEDGARGALLELYLWRIKHILGEQARVVFLSAVAPNIKELAEWMGKRPGGITTSQRATRMRVGVYRVKGRGKKAQGWIDYSDGTQVCVVDGGVITTQRRGLVQLAEKLGAAGPLLTVAQGKGTCERLALEMQGWLKASGTLKNLTDAESGSAEIQRLDSRLEREMYATVPLRQLIRNRIAYHHAGLPPRVRISVEEAIRANLIDYVFATTTLAEGVNFPFSTVIVQSLALREPPEKGRPPRYHMVTPRTFWNIAGRAGRPGHDREGQAILFEPSLGLERVNATIDNYLNTDLGAIEPVRSALGMSLDQIATGMFAADHTNSVVLDKSLPKHIHASINLLRVGLVHARASKIIAAPEEILEGTFAARHYSAEHKDIVARVIAMQDRIVEDFVSHRSSFPVELISELGVSLETLQLLLEYVENLDDWRFEKLVHAMYGGRANLAEAPYIVGPVAKRMTELEGAPLGASLGLFYSDMIVLWLSGIPLQTVRNRAPDQNRWKRVEDLISVIYSRIQYLLPWGLYALHRIVAEEAKKRSIEYHDEIRNLAYLADAGVPNLDAFRLVGLNFERVDATRLAQTYRESGGERLGVDIVGWLLNAGRPEIESSVRGVDKRRLDYDLFALIRELKISTQVNRTS